MYVYIYLLPTQVCQSYHVVYTSVHLCGCTVAINTVVCWVGGEGRRLGLGRGKGGGEREKQISTQGGNE